MLSVLMLVVLLFFSNRIIAQDSRIEYKIKAGYLYNFTKFISWPESDSATFNLCILGKDPFGSIINPIEKRTVKNKPIRLFRLQAVSEIRRCQIVYFGESGKESKNSGLLVPGILTISSQEKILSVSESKKFARAGGMIAFILKEGKIKLYINLQALKKSGLEVSAKLLEVAEVYDGGEDE